MSLWAIAVMALEQGVDLALLKLSKMPFRAKVLEFEDFSNVRIGEPVFVIGNSLGYGTCITSGIVSDKERNVNGKMLLMTDCAVNGGIPAGLSSIKRDVSSERSFPVLPKPRE